jgi:hypothetical protein
MFTKLAGFRLADFRLARSRRPTPRSRAALTHCNDNSGSVRRPPAAGRRRSVTPALACHWFDRDGRLECHWEIESGGDAPAADLGPRGRAGSVSTAGRRRTAPLGRRAEACAA